MNELHLTFDMIAMPGFLILCVPQVMTNALD
jgi:hypothetical protein